MEIIITPTFVAIIHGAFVIILLIIGLFISRRNFSFDGRLIAKAKSKIEQGLVLEAISACAGKLDFQSIVKSIGEHAAEMTGYSNWIIWLYEDDGKFRVSELDFGVENYKLEHLQTCHDPQLYSWLARNHEPVVCGSYIVEFADSEVMKNALTKLSNGLLIPFIDGQSILGFIILGGERILKEKRSDQFLSLFGAFAAIIIKKGKLDLKERELRRKQQRDENFAAMGKMAAGLAHEIRNPLAFIRASTEYLTVGEYADPRKNQVSRSIIEQIDRVNNHVESLLSLGRIDPQQFVQINVVELVKKVIYFTGEKARESDIKLDLDIGNDDIVVYGSEEKLWQLVLNLVINATEALVSGGQITLRTYATGQNAIIEVEDTGDGIDPGIVDKIFDPFFSTKEKGTGLGLATGLSIARAHQGSLELVTKDSEGTCFRISLPLAE